MVAFCLCFFVVYVFGLYCHKYVLLKYKPHFPFSLGDNKELNWEPGEDIRYHELRKTLEIYTPCFCWCRPSVKLISVCTNRGEEERKCIRASAHASTMSRNFPFSASLPLWVSFFLLLFIFFYVSQSSVLNTLRRLSCSPTFLPHWSPIKLGFLYKAAIQNLPSFIFLNK